MVPVTCSKYDRGDEQLCGGKVHVDLWCWPLDVDPPTLALSYAALTSEERSRAEKFALKLNGDRFAVARAGLRSILGARVALPPADLEFVIETFGKPRLKLARAPHFNLSHSGGLAALGVCDDTEIGVDIEMVRRMEEDVARHFFAPDEQRRLAVLRPSQAVHAFYECWTRKEAVVKALGDGLQVPLDTFAVSFGPGEDARLLEIKGDDARCWSIAAFEPEEGFLGAVAARSDGRPIHLTRRTSG